MSAPGTLRLEGACCCGNVRVALGWPEDAGPAIPAYACNCDLCVTHRAVWISHPRGRHLRTADAARVRLARAGTATSDFHVCATCGVVPIATRVMKGARYAIVNATALHDVKGLRRVQAAVAFEGETNEARVGWWWRYWTPEAAGDGRA